MEKEIIYNTEHKKLLRQKSIVENCLGILFAIVVLPVGMTLLLLILAGLWYVDVIIIVLVFGLIYYESVLDSKLEFYNIDI